ncbi:NAD(P)/FAD-dependent oxidoreductase, partial [bacterium]|nr:NAD(P)/FAD-dependent oxidoreductase [bacterium]
MIYHYDIVNIGGGLAGSLSAYLFAKEGRKVLLIEKREKSFRKVCGEYLCPPAVTLLKKHKLEGLLDPYRKIHGMKLASPRGTMVDTSFPQGDFINYGYSVKRGQFDQDLLELCEAAGCTVLRGKRVQKITKTEDTYEIIGQDLQVRCNLLIGADGINSFTARTLKLSKNIKQDRIVLHSYLNSKTHNINKGEMHILEDGSYLGVNPISKSQLNLCLIVKSEKIKGKNLQEYFFQRLEKSPQFSHRYKKDKYPVRCLFPIHSQCHSPIGDQVALIGDAAGFYDPLTGEGMYLALLGADLLQDALKNIPDLAKTELLNQALQVYKQRRKSLLWDKMLVLQGFQFLIQKKFL